MVTFHRTAIARNGLSIPARLLRGEILAANRSLDFGCGRGLDADILGMEKYDPNGYPSRPSGKYGIILCSYVLNVVSVSEQAKILKYIQKLLCAGGAAYITVRRDSAARIRQRMVRLGLPVYLHKKGSFCIYRMDG